MARHGTFVTTHSSSNSRLMTAAERIRCFMSGPHLSPRASQYDWALLALLALSLSFNVLIAFRFTMAGSNTPQLNATNANRAPAPAVGSAMPPVMVHRLGGGSEAITWGGQARPTLLYVFTPSCRWCGRNAKNLKALADRIKDSHRIVGLSLDPDVEAVGAYARAHEMNFPIYIRPHGEAVAAYRFGATPQTFLLDSSGKLVHSWIGAYAGPVGEEIKGVFEVELPGLVR
jgi:peroxiredoxin